MGRRASPTGRKMLACIGTWRSMMVAWAKVSSSMSFSAASTAAGSPEITCWRGELRLVTATTPASRTRSSTSSRSSAEMGNTDAIIPRGPAS